MATMLAVEVVVQEVAQSGSSRGQNGGGVNVDIRRRAAASGQSNGNKLPIAKS